LALSQLDCLCLLCHALHSLKKEAGQQRSLASQAYFSKAAAEMI